MTMLPKRYIHWKWLHSHCNIFLRVYAWNVIKSMTTGNVKIWGEKPQNKTCRQKLYHISYLLVTHWSKNSQHIVVSEESRSIKLTYCIWWNSWVLTSASCFSCNFLSVSPPKDLSIALPPRGTEGQRSPSMKTMYMLCVVTCSCRRMLTFCLFIPNSRGWAAMPSKAIDSTVGLSTETPSLPYTFKSYLTHTQLPF